jgi:putative zinc ribbon protein
VLLARTEEQNYAVFPRRYYVDVLRTCGSCARHFIFFAKEQRYWFETLKFFVDADCVLCPDCRRESRSIQRRLRRYSDLMKRETRAEDELQVLVDDATYLFERGVLRNVAALGALKNEALRSIPGYLGTVTLAQALAKARGT